MTVATVAPPPLPRTVYARVPRLWPGGTVVCLASGESLTREDVDAVRGRAHVVAVGNTYTLAPWAEVLFMSDAKWWAWHEGVPDFAGLKYAMHLGATRWPGVQVLRDTGPSGLESDPSGLRNGCNSGYMAINLAHHLGAGRIVLLGYDMHGGHFFGAHPDQSRPPFLKCLPHFDTLIAPLAAAGIEMLNCTRQTRLTCFPRVALEEALS